MAPIIKFLNDHRDTYTEVKKKHQPPTSVVPSTKFGKGTIVKGSDLLTSRSESSFLPPIEEERGGGGAIRILGKHK
jgi:hypothetical protein